MTGIDDLTDAMAKAIWSRTHDLTPWSSISDISLGGAYRADARYALDVVQALLRERGLLLGPDGLIKAERYTNGVELCTTHDEFHIEAYTAPSGRHVVACVAHDEDCVMVPVYTLSPQDPTEEP